MGCCHTLPPQLPPASVFPETCASHLAFFGIEIALVQAAKKQINN